MDTTKLVIEAQSGSHAAYCQLVRQYQRLATLWAWNTIDDFHLAQDVAQDAFVIAFKKLKTLRDPNAFSGWMRQIVRRQALKHANGVNRHQPHPGPESHIPDHRGGPPAWLDRHTTVLEAIKSLPDHEQEVVVLYYLDNQSASEVASCLARPIGTVTKQLSRAIERLQNILIEVRHESE